MIRYIICLFICLISASVLYSQNKELFLIAGQGCPGNCADEYSQHYPVHLFQFHNEKLVVFDTLATGNEYVFKIASYFDYKMVLVYKSSLTTNKKTFLRISHDKNIFVDSIVREFPKEEFLVFDFFLIDIGQPWIIVKYYHSSTDSSDSVSYYGINLITGKDSLMSSQIIKSIHIEGEQGIALVNGLGSNSEMMKIGSSNTVDGITNFKVMHPQLSIYDTVKMELPNIFQLHQNFKYITSTNQNTDYFRLVPVKTNKIICIATTSNWDGKDLIGYHNVELYNSEKNQWKTQTFPGRYRGGKRVFGEWLSGYAAYSHQYGYIQKIEKFGAIPGLKYRLEQSIYGNTIFDQRAKELQLFPEGILYLYNMKTFKYIEWDALENGEHQGDSEILLVQDDTVYYRINDKIYSAAILNGEKLGEATLLVEDPRVPDVHWAFLSKQE